MQMILCGYHVPAGNAGHLPEAETGSGARPPYAGIPGGHGDVLCGRHFRKSAQLVYRQQKMFRRGHKKQLSDIMRAVYQVENTDCLAETNED